MAEILLQAATSYGKVYDVDTWAAPAGAPTISESCIGGCTANSAGTLAAFGGNFTDGQKCRVYSTSDWSLLNITNQITYTCKGVSFSSDGDYLAILGASNTDATERFRVYDTSDWSWHKSNYSGFSANNTEKVRYHPSGDYIAVGISASPWIRIIDTSDWSTVTLDAGFSLPSVPYGMEFSNDGSYLAISHVNSPYLTIMDCSDWSDAGVDVTSDLPATIYYVVSVHWSSDDAWLATAHDDGNYVTVFDTSDWSPLTGLATLNNSNQVRQVRFTTDDSLLIISTSTSAYQTEAYDTSDWSYVTIGDLPDTNGYYGLATLATPVYNQFLPKARFSGNEDWGFSPDQFQGLAVIEGGTRYSSGCYDGTGVRIFRYWPDSGKYMELQTIPPQNNDESQFIAFAPGNKYLWHGAGTPDLIGYSERQENTRWEEEFSKWEWGSMLNGSQPTCMTWSDDMKYRVGTYHDIYEHEPFFEYWDGDSWESWDLNIQERVDGWTICEALAHWHRVGISPDGQYVAQSTTSGVIYANTPYFFIWYNDGTKFFNQMDIDFDGHTFSNSDGFFFDWSPNSQFIISYGYVFEYNETSEAWEIVHNAAHDWQYRASWHPDTTYLATHSGGNVTVYSISGSTFTTAKNLTGFTGTVTNVHFSKDGLYLFVGINPYSGSAFYQYDVDGGNFTANTTNNALWATIVDDVVMCETCDPPRIADAGKFSLETEVGSTLTDFADGLLFDSGAPLEITYNITGQSSLYTAAPFLGDANFSDGTSVLLGVDAGKFSLEAGVLGDEVPATTAGFFTHTYSITGALPMTYDLFDLINAERVLNGLDPYVRNTKLAAASEVGVAEMVATEGGTYTSSVADLIHNAGYVYITAGAIPTKLDESFTAQELFDAWMDSPAVEAYILHETMEDIGIATDNYNGNNYVSVIMALWHPQYQVVDVPTITMEYSLPTSPFFDFLSAESYATFLANSASPYLPKYAAKIGDYYIPSLISFTYRLSNSKPSRVELNFVYTPEVLSELETRIEDGISVESVIDYKGATVRNVVMSASIENVAFAGKESPVITLSGFNNLNYYQSTLALQNVMTKTVDEDGKIRFRCQTPDFYLRPGATVTYGSDSIVIGEVVVFVRDGLNQYMEIKEE